MSRSALQAEMQTVGRHWLIYVMGPAFSRLIGFLLIPIYTRFISPDRYGVLSLVDIMMTLLMMVLAMGLADALPRFYYETKDPLRRRRLLSAFILGAAGIGLPLVMAATLAAPWLRVVLGIDAQYLAYLQLALIASWFSMLVEAGYAYLRMCYLSHAFLAATIVQILASLLLNIWLVVGLDLGIWGILYSTVAVQGVLGTLMAGMLLWQARCWPEWRELRDMLAFGMPLVPSTIALQLNNYLNPVMIRWLLPGDPITSLAQVGLFTAGQKIATIVNRFVTVPIQSFWRPRRMELMLEGGEQVGPVLARICTYSLLLTAQAALLLSVSAENGLKLVVDVRYWTAADVVPVLAAAYVVLGLEHHFSSGMHFARKTLWSAAIGLAALGVMVVWNILLLPRWGSMAAATATLTAVSIRTVGHYLISQRCHFIPFEVRRILHVAVAAVGLYLASRWVAIDSNIGELAARVGIGSLLLPMLVATAFFSAGELAAARRVIAHWLILPKRASAVDVE